MTFTIGRASFAGSPYDLRHDGDRLSFAIDIDTESAASVAAAKVLRQQVLGLADNADEPVIPVTWSDDSDLDGFYRVGRVEVAPFPVFLANGFAPCRIDLERVGGGFATPVHEVYAIGVDASSADLSPTNGFSGIANEAAVYFPSSHTVINDTTSATGRDVADGTTINEVISAIDDNGSWTIGLSHLCNAADFYDAAATIEQQISGTWYKVVGRQVIEGATLRVHNGIVRVTVATTGVITVEHWDGAAWVSKSYTLTYNSGSGTISGFSASQIYKNGPDTCLIRLTGATSSAEACNIDVSVQRGHNVAEFTLGTYSQQTWKIARTSTETSTDITDASANDVAVRASANDANGDRFVLSGRGAVTTTVNGDITLAASPTPSANGNFPGSSITHFGIGMEIDGSSATGANTAASLAARYQVAMFLHRSVST